LAGRAATVGRGAAEMPSRASGRSRTQPYREMVRAVGAAGVSGAVPAESSVMAIR
jgi:hypothetical protein